MAVVKQSDLFGYALEHVIFKFNFNAINLTL